MSANEHFRYYTRLSVHLKIRETALYCDLVSRRHNHVRHDIPNQNICRRKIGYVSSMDRSLAWWMKFYFYLSEHFLGNSRRLKRHSISILRFWKISGYGKNFASELFFYVYWIFQRRHTEIFRFYQNVWRINFQSWASSFLRFELTFLAVSNVKNKLNLSFSNETQSPMTQDVFSKFSFLFSNFLNIKHQIFFHHFFVSDSQKIATDGVSIYHQSWRLHSC